LRAQPSVTIATVVRGVAAGSVIGVSVKVVIAVIEYAGLPPLGANSRRVVGL
jgi:hypothetical protein